MAERARESLLASERKRALISVLDEGGDQPIERRESIDGNGADLSGAHEEEETHKTFRERLMDSVSQQTRRAALGPSNWCARLSQVLTNAEVTVDGLRAAYQDVLPDQTSFSFIAVVHSLQVEACNSEWQPQFMERAQVSAKAKAVHF